MGSSTFHSIFVEKILSSGTIAIAGLIIASYFLTVAYFPITCRSRVGRIPRLGKSRHDFEVNGRNIIRDGYQKYKSSTFRVQSTDMERIVVSPRFIDELKGMPESVLSTRHGMCERHLGKYTTMDVILTSSLQNNICRSQLTHNLHALVFPMQEEAIFWMTSRLPKIEGGVKLPAYEALLHITAAVSSRIFIGLPSSRDPIWLKTALGYTLDVFRVSSALRPYPAVIRSLISPFLHSTKQLTKRIAAANRCIRPLIVERLANSSTLGANQDVIQWMVEKAHGVDRDPDILVKKLLFLTLAAIHTSTMSITHIIFDLCSMPEYIDTLRREISELIGKRELTLSNLNELMLLDSFMKESQRVNHPGLLSFNRKVMSPLRLSDGQVIPTGSFISMATESIAHDPTVYPEPDQFDGYRFSNMRNASDEALYHYQFVTTSPESLAFGHGKFACPGRFFASAIIKVVIVTILTEYDISFPRGQFERPKNLFFGEAIRPDPSQTIIFSPRN